MKDRIILFGGSFDPIHEGHVKVVDGLMKEFPDAKIIVMPSKNHLKSNSLIPIEDRILATKMAFSDYSNVEVVDWTLHEDTSSTYEVYLRIKEKNPGSDVFVAAGDDVLQSIHRWKFFPKVLDDVNWIILSRHPNKIKEDPSNMLILEHLDNIKFINGCISEMSSSAIRKDPDRFFDKIPTKCQSLVRKYLFRNK